MDGDAGLDWGAAREHAIEDPLRRPCADVVDEIAHLRHAGRTLHQLAIGKSVLIDQPEEGFEAPL